MESLVFLDKAIIPDEKQLTEWTKGSYGLYSDLYKQVKKIRPDIQTQWQYYGQKNGWLLKHLDGKRNLFFLVVYDGFFKLSFTFGDSVVATILASKAISMQVKQQLEASQKYAEGTTMLLSVKTESDVEQATLLIQYKLGIK